jgi:hypothetical protein
MHIFSTDVVPITSARARLTEIAADHMRNLHDLSRAAREVAAGKSMSVAAFRKQATALVTGVAPERPATSRKKAVKRKTG